MVIIVVGIIRADERMICGRICGICGIRYRRMIYYRMLYYRMIYYRMIYYRMI